MLEIAEKEIRPNFNDRSELLSLGKGSKLSEIISDLGIKHLCLKGKSKHELVYRPQAGD